MNKELSDALDGFEGRFPHFYKDGGGVVTCAVGHACFSLQQALAIPVFYWDHFELVQADFETISNLPIFEDAHRYALFCKARLKEFAIDALKDGDLEHEQSILVKTFPQFNSYPSGPQNGLLDMGFNLGGGFCSKPGSWPHFRMAVLAQNWTEAAVQSKRTERPAPNGIQPARNIWVYQQFMKG